ncbi:MAG: rRNA maturation RNase YbeY [Anaerolineales bacterium]
MIHLHIDKRYRGKGITELLKKTAKTALSDLGVAPETDVSLVITGDSPLRKLNRQFLGEDRVTDVLSFPSGESGDGPHYLGDVVISFPRARAQAKAVRHSVHAELQLLAVHGILHLLGYDHGTAQAKSRMWAAQAKILAKLGVVINIIPERSI